MREQFKSDGPQFEHGLEELRWLETVSSTNDVLADLARGQSVAVLSWNQTEGRGRLGRRWESLRGRSLALSYCPGLSISHFGDSGIGLGLISLQVAGCLVDALEPFVEGSVTIKWPNDVLIEGKKIAGILGEITPREQLILGIGLNVNHSRDELPTQASTSLVLNGFDPSKSMVSFLELLFERFRSLFQTDSLTSSFSLRPILPKLETLGQRIRIYYPSGAEVVGLADALGSSGQLVVKVEPSGNRLEVSSADIVHLRADQIGNTRNAD